MEHFTKIEYVVQERRKGFTDWYDGVSCRAPEAAVKLCKQYTDEGSGNLIFQVVLRETSVTETVVYSNEN